MTLMVFLKELFEEFILKQLLAFLHLSAGSMQHMSILQFYKPLKFHAQLSSVDC